MTESSVERDEMILCDVEAVPIGTHSLLRNLDNRNHFG